MCLLGRLNAVRNVRITHAIPIAYYIYMCILYTSIPTIPILYKTDGVEPVLWAKVRSERKN